MPAISVIVPVYNAETTLRRCVDSILKQAFVDFEVLLIDDGSTDSSGQICDEYGQKDSRVRIFHTENGGASSARNKGLDNAKGDWITFCDSDDYVYPDWLGNYHLQSGDRYGLLCQGIMSSKSLDNRINCEFHYGTEFKSDRLDGLERLFAGKILGYTGIKAFRRDIIQTEHLRFNTGIKLREDLEFVLRYLQFIDKIKCVKEAGYYYEVPDWNSKYKFNINNSLNFYRSAFKCVKYLGVGKGSPLRTEIREGYTNCLNIMFAGCESFSQRKRCLNEIVSILTTDYEESQIFRPTKFILRYDKSGILAQACYSIHSLLRKKNFKG